MRILIYSTYYFPELVGIGKYNAEMAEWLARQGHEVSVVTAPPFYPNWQVQSPYRSWAYHAERINNVNIYRSPLWVPSRPNGVKRLLHLLSFTLFSFPLLLLQLLKRPDVILLVEPPLFCAPQAWLIARLFGSKAWLHIQDFEVDAAFELGLIRANWMRRFALGIECWLMRRFDLVSSISPNMLDKVLAKGIAAEHVAMLPNWVDTAEIFPLNRLSSYREELGIGSDVCVALYSGNMGEKQGLDVLLNIAKLLSHQHKLLFVLCGDGAARARLVKQADEMKNVKWLPLQPTEQLNELLNLADIHLLPQKEGVSDLVMPSKLLGMMASGKAILAMVEENTQLAQEVRLCGKVVHPGQIEEIATVLLELATQPEERFRLGKLSLKAVKKWDKDQILSNFESTLETIVE